MPQSKSKSRTGAAAARGKEAAPKKRSSKRAAAGTKPGKAGSIEAAGGAPRKSPRPPARKTFLIAATMPDGGTKSDLRVYAAVTRTPGDALAAVRAELGGEVSVELTGKLSNRMAKTLGLKADEVRHI